jgi:hypothetical protein
MKHIKRIDENIKLTKDSWSREEVIDSLRSISKDIFKSFNDEEFNEIKMRNEYGYQKGIAFDIWINKWIDKNF